MILSDERIPVSEITNFPPSEWQYPEEKVKASIKELREDLCGELLSGSVNESSCDRIPQKEILSSIKKHFGKDLI